MNMRNYKCTALICALLMTACSGAGNSAGSSGTESAKAATQQINIDQIRQNVTKAESSLTNAQTALGTIFNSDGSFNWGIFLGGVDFSQLGAGTQTCLQNAFPTQNVATLVLFAPNEIATALKCILDDVVSVAGIAQTDMANALNILNTALAQVPAGSSDAVAIQAMVSEIQSLQVEYSTTMSLVSTQVGLAVTFLNTLPSMATSLIPVPILSMLGGMAVQMFVQPIVTEIITFQNQLKAL